jgi:hypothetical protein
MNYLLRTIGGLAVFAITSLAHGALITTNLEDATNGGGFFGVLTFEDTAANTVTITADISDPINVGLTQGDILALWFDFDDFSALSGTPSFTNEDPSGTVGPALSIGENSVGNSLGGFLNINGSGSAAWDMALQVGTNGATGGFNQTVSFDLTWLGLNALQFDSQRVGMRVQSIEGGSFEGGSSKLRKVPEPSILLLFSLGLLGLGLARSKPHA